MERRNSGKGLRPCRFSIQHGCLSDRVPGVGFVRRHGLNDDERAVKGAQGGNNRGGKDSLRLTHSATSCNSGCCW